MLDDTYTPLSQERLEQIADPCRNGPQSVALALEVLALRKGAERLLNVARGCHDYGGGYAFGEKAEAFHHGIQTVINALEAFAKSPNELQVRVLEGIGAKEATR